MLNKEFYALIPESCAQLEKGVFLTTEGPENPMTIGWAQFGYVWGKPVVQVLVRKSRYTYEWIDKAATFTLSVPREGEMVKELAFCGSHSGRDGDKMAAAGLSASTSVVGGAKGVAGCGAYFECRIVFKQDTDLANMELPIRARYYGANQAGDAGDPHTLFYGEVVAAYKG